MDKIKKYLKLLEGEYVEEDIESLSAKDRLNFYLLLKEFEVPKLARAGYMSGADDIGIIEVKYAKKPKADGEDKTE